ncbi:MAG: hypothetical protein RLP14_08135 [Owenweeksia sp.]
MHHYRSSTQLPNRLVDHYLKSLSESELKVILVILRRTIGMVDLDHLPQRKERAWISQKLFMLITGLSNRAVSSAVDTLVRKSLITVTDADGNTLPSTVLRKAASRLHYALGSPVLVDKPAPTSDPLGHNPVKKAHTIKLNSDISREKRSLEKASLGITPLTDHERLKQIRKVYLPQTL